MDLFVSLLFEENKLFPHSAVLAFVELNTRGPNRSAKHAQLHPQSCGEIWMFKKSPEQLLPWLRAPAILNLGALFIIKGQVPTPGGSFSEGKILKQLQLELES
jgi:hypothetical protein